MRRGVAFYYKNGFDSQRGGVQAVSLSLASVYIKEGFRVFLIAEKSYHFASDLDVTHVLLSKNRKCLLREVEELIINKNIELIINQEGLSNRAGLDLLKVFSSNSCRLISVIHNDPKAPIYEYAYRLSKLSRYWKSNSLMKCLTFIYFLRHKKDYRYLVKFSSKTVVLSRSYGLYLSEKCDIAFDMFEVLPNPVKYNQVAIDTKHDSVLYVGRLNVSQKRLDSLLRIWARFELANNKATLSLIGEGSDSDSLKRQAEQLGLKRTEFLGLKNPAANYANSKVLCLTSAFEGFPLVLFEALKFRVVPIVFNTFSSASDIITDGYNGRIVEEGSEAQFCEAIQEVLANYEKYAQNIDMIQSKIPSSKMIYDSLQK